MRRTRARTLGEQAIAEARNLQSRFVSSEINNSHMMINTPYGWTVRAAHPEGDKPYTPPVGIVEKTDALCQSPRGTNRMRMQRRAHEQLANAKRAQVSELTKLRNLARQRLHSLPPEVHDFD